MTRRAVRFSVLLVALAGPASAQLISIKTVPIAQGDQFDIFPSNNFGMGGVPLALPTIPPRKDAYGNQYAFGMVGKRLPGARVTLGASLMWARLTGVDGVDLLYAGSAGLKQFGHTLDVRVGLLKEWTGDRSLEALVLLDRFGM